MGKSHTYLSEDAIINLLAEKYSGSAWAFLPQVRSHTGYAGTVRTADAVAMSVWPSRGLHIIGFEVKSSRHDWVRELGRPEKAEEICKFCDYWWVVAPEGVVQVDELPKTWGLMVPADGKLVVKVEAPLIQADTPSKPFLASLLRKAQDRIVQKPQIDDLLRKEFERGKETARTVTECEVKRAREELDSLQKELRDFEAKSGIRITKYSDGERLGLAVGVVTHQQGLDRAIAEVDGDIAREEGKLAGLKRQKDILMEARSNVPTE